MEDIESIGRVLSTTFDSERSHAQRQATTSQSEMHDQPMLDRTPSPGPTSENAARDSATSVASFLVDAWLSEQHPLAGAAESPSASRGHNAHVAHGATTPSARREPQPQHEQLPMPAERPAQSSPDTSAHAQFDLPALNARPIPRVDSAESKHSALPRPLPKVQLRDQAEPTSLADYLKSRSIEQLMESGALLEKCPADLQRKLVTRFRPLFQRLSELDAEDPRTQQDHEALLRLILCMLVHNLKVPRGGRDGRGKRAAANVHKRMESLVRGFALGIIHEEDIAAPARRSAGPDTPVNEEKQLCDRAVRKLELGQLGKASKVLTSSKICDPENQAVKDQLNALHPQVDHVLPALPPDAPRVTIVGNDALREQVRAMASAGAGAGPSGITAHHLLPFFNDAQCLRSLAKVLTNVGNGTYSSDMRDFLLTNKGLALDKNPGVRPIGIGDTIYRIAAGYLVGNEKEHIVEAVGEFQYGQGRPCGTEAVVHMVQEALESATPIAVIDVDVRNAFNTRDLAHMLETMYGIPSLAPLWRLLNWKYKSPTKVLYQNRKGRIVHTVLNKQGVVQGDNAGSCMFDIDIAEDAREALLASDGSVRLVLLHDDIRIIGPPDKLRPVYERLKAALATHGSVVQPKKSRFTYYHEQPLPADVVEWIRAEQFAYETDATEVAGGVVAKTVEAGQRKVVEMVQAMHPYFKLVGSEFMPVQHGLRLLRNCGPARTTYLFRTTRPEFTNDGAQLVEEYTFDCLSRKLDMPIDPDSELSHQVRLAVKEGGIGPFRDQRKLRSLAWLSSVAACRQYLVPEDRKEQMSVPFTKSADAVLQHVRDTIGSMSEKSQQALAFIDELLPESGEQFSDFYGRDPSRATGLQSQLSAILSVQTLLASSLNTDTPRLASLLRPGAGEFLTAPLTSPSVRLSDAETIHAIRHRLGLPPSSNPEDLKEPQCLVCGRDLVASDPDHSLTCTRNTATQKNRRHHTIKNSLATWSRRAGAATSVEPINWSLARTDNKRVDLEIDLNTATYQVDVVITNSTAPSNAKNDGGIGAVARAEARKRHKYRAFHQPERGLKVQAFALDSYGALGDDAIDLVHKIAEYATDRSPEGLTSADIRSGLIAELSADNARANARMSQSWITKQRRARRQRTQLRQLVSSVANNQLGLAAR